MIHLTGSLEANEPAFLRRLKAEHGGGDSSRHERPLARPRKQMKDGEEDDEPTYVVEASQDTLSKEEYESLVKGKVHDKAVNEETSSSTPSLAISKLNEKDDAHPPRNEPAKQKVAAIGASNKRRLFKVVGDEGDEDDEAASLVQGEPARQARTPKAKKGKKVKLSFDAEEKSRRPK